MTGENKWSERMNDPFQLNKCPPKRDKGTDESFELKKVPMKKVTKVIDLCNKDNGDNDDKDMYNNDNVDNQNPRDNKDTKCNDDVDNNNGQNSDDVIAKASEYFIFYTITFQIQNNAIKMCSLYYR